jgi:hypothetical protein
MELTYSKNGDYYIPNLIPDPEPEGEIRKYGLMRRNFLKDHHKGVYSAMLMRGKLKEHLLQIQEQAEARFDLLVDLMAAQEGVTEQMKAEDQMLWVRKMNNIRASAEEIVLQEIVYDLWAAKAPR